MKIFIVWITFTLLELKNCNSHETVYKSNKWCKIVTSSEENKILKYNQGQKRIKIPFAIYIGFETVL